jgi:4-oxalocrotonate tautomerase family enzyme|tara:strand:+ start:882 stop:1106 length:225 start_codon:yes stop_codon:yes gene_type:complete
VVKNLWFFLGVKMPYINLKVGGKLTDEQKKEIITQFTKTLETVASKPASSTYIVIDEVSRDLWSVGGKLLSEND